MQYLVMNIKAWQNGTPEVLVLLSEY